MTKRHGNPYSNELPIFPYLQHVSKKYLGFLWNPPKGRAKAAAETTCVRLSCAKMGSVQSKVVKAHVALEEKSAPQACARVGSASNPRESNCRKDPVRSALPIQAVGSSTWLAPKVKDRSCGVRVLVAPCRTQRLGSALVLAGTFAEAGTRLCQLIAALGQPNF